MKVVHIEERFHPGMGYQINFFARYHTPGYRFYILTSNSSRLWTASDEEEDLETLDKSFEKRYDVTIHRLPSAMDRRSKHNIWLKGLVRTIRSINPDILYVHTLESYSSLRIILSRRILSEYTLFFDTHTLLNQFRRGIKYRVFLWFLRQVASKRIERYGACVFATVPENRMILKDIYKIPGDRILYSPIGTDLSVFNYDPGSGIEIKKREKLEENGTVLLYTGKINARKNPHLILEAVTLLEERIEAPLYLYFVGAADEGYREKYMQKGFSNECIQTRFIPALPVTELFKWYSMADFAVFPSENTLSALDAQACRLPVIMESDTTNRERLTKGGMTYEKGDLRELSEKIWLLISNPDQCEKLGREGEEFIRANYDYRKIVQEMESDLGLTNNNIPH